MSENNLDVFGDLITQSEAAELRGVSKASISELVKRGRLKTKEIFGKKLVYRSEVLAFEKEKPGPKIENQSETAKESPRAKSPAQSQPTKRRAKSPAQSKPTRKKAAK